VFGYKRRGINNNEVEKEAMEQVARIFSVCWA
jgi:hypothetical protein